jgi:hypothetical protein
VGLLVAAVAACADAGPTPGAQVPAQVPTGQQVLMTLVAHDIALEPTSLTAPAGVALHVEMENRDPGIPHGLVLLADTDFSTTLRSSEIVAGPAATTIDVPGLVPGRYRFGCPVHPNMAADLTVIGS